MNRICLYLFGSFRLEKDAIIVTLPTRKIEALLAHLVLYQHAHAREQLAGLLWGDSSDEHARRSLRTALSALRKHVAGDLVLADRETVQLNPACPIWVDALEFQQQADQFLNADAPDDVGINLDLYQGDLLVDFYEDWIASQREAYRTLWIDTSLRLTQQLRARGEYGQAITVARKLLAVDSTNERAHQHLMFCHATVGDRAAALKQYDECVRKLGNELGVEPSAATVALYERIKQTEAHPCPLETANTNLPIPLTSFIGRSHEMVEVKQLLSTTRLLTLTGVGGCGKTRLAIQVASELVDQYPDGVWWVELSALSGEKWLPRAVNKVLGITEPAGVSAAETLVNYLRLKRLLLVLDNCEHLVTACAQLAETVLNQCAGVQIFVTSREVLSIYGEVAWLVPSLGLPAGDEGLSTEALLQGEGTRLFVERARAVRNDFTVTPANAPAVLQICRRLDGIALAIELAAARVKTLTIEQIAVRLEDRFNLLTMGSRTAFPHHQTLRGAIDWSYALLSPGEQALLPRLSAFAGSWSLAAAEMICAGDDVEPSQVLDLLTHLVDKSLVVTAYPENETRYRMLETVRQYVAEKLSETGAVDTIHDRHLRYFTQLALSAGAQWHGTEQGPWLRRTEADYANFREALEWALEQETHEPWRLTDGLQLAIALGPYWNLQAEYDEGRHWLEMSVARIGALVGISGSSKAPGPVSADVRPFLLLKAQALYGLGVLVWFQSYYETAYSIFKESAELYEQLGDVTGWAYSAIYWAHGEWERKNAARAYALWEQCIAHFREVNDRWGVAWTLAFLGRAARESEDYETARRQYEQSAALMRDVGDRWALSIVLSHLGMTALQQGNLASAQSLFEQRLAIGRELGFKQHTAYALYLLGLVAWKQHRVSAAEQSFRESLALNHRLGNIYHTLGCLVGLVWALVEKGQVQRARRLFEAVEAADAGFGSQGSAGDRFTYKPMLAEVRDRLSKASLEEARVESPPLTLEQAIQKALTR